MSIRIKAEVANPQTVDLTMTITLPVELWERLFAVIDKAADSTGAQPFYNLRNAIRKAVYLVRQNIVQPMDDL